MSTNDSVDTYFIDLALRGDALQTEVGKYVKELERALGQELGGVTEKVEQRFISMGKVMGNSIMGAVSVLAQTKNPIAALTSGLMSMNAGVQAAAQGGATWAQSIAGLLGPLAALVTVLSVVAGGFQKVVNFLMQTGEQGVRLSAQVQTLNTGLEVIAKNAGVNIDVVREKVSTLQATGITTQESIQSLMQFLSQGLPIDNVEKLARAGQNMAVAFGRNSTETFNRFVYAITTGNAEVLQQVGIQKSASVMMEEYALTVNKAVGSLTGLERRQAIMNGIIREAENYTGLYEKSMESLGKRIGSLPRYIEEGTLALGQTLLPILELSVVATEKFWKEFQKLFVVMETVEIDGQLKKIPVQLADGTQKLTAFGQQIKDVAQAIEDRFLPPIEWIISHLPEMASGVGRVADVLTTMVTPGVQILLDLLTLVQTIITNIANQLLAIGNSITGETATWQDGLVALKQVAEIVVVAIVTGLSAVSSGIMSITQLLNNESPTAWTNWKDTAIKAAQDVFNAMEGIKEEATNANSILLEMASRRKYEQETGQQAVTISGVGGGVVDMSSGHMGRQETVETETPAYTAWKQKQNIIAQAIAAGTPTSGQKEKDAAAAAKRAAEIQKAGTQMADAIDSANEAVDAAGKRFYGKGGTLEKFDESVAKAMTRLSESLTKALENLKKQVDKAKEKLAIDFAKQLVELDKQGNKAREDENTRFNESQIRATEDFQLSMKKMDEDYRQSMADFAQARDAKGALKAMRDFAINKKNATEDFSQQQTREREDHNKRLEEITRRQEEIRAQMQEAYQERLKDLDKAMEEQAESMREQNREQMEELTKNAKERRNEMMDAHNEQLKDMKEANTKRLKEMVEHWVDLGLVDKEGASDILKGLDEYYGKEGKIEKLIKDFVLRAERNKVIKITLELGGDAGQPPSTTPVCPAGYRWSDARRQCVKKDEQEPMAAGGLVTADRPTSILMGEAGPESALFLPANSKMGLGQAMALMSGGGGASGGRTFLDIALRVTADGNISSEFENAILDRLADVVLEALPTARLEKSR